MTVDFAVEEHPDAVDTVDVVDVVPSVGIAGAVAFDVRPPVTGCTLGVGTSVAELTPRLLISVEPRGMPVRAPPPDVVGEVAVGLDEAAILLEPEPHMPDVPAVSSTPDDVVIPELCAIPDVVDIPEVADNPDEGSADDIELVVIPPPS